MDEDMDERDAPDSLTPPINSDVPRIGTCGFRTSQENYARMLSSVEVQHTFYQPPTIKTLECWRSAMPQDFEFTLKAWQLITHDGSSPTYRRLRKPLPEKESSSVGSFRWTSIVKDAWQTTLQSAKALNARTVLFQCPAKFEPTSVNIRRMTRFFGEVDRQGLNFAWEPRGPEWTDKIISSLCADLRLWHAVDPFTRRTVTPDHCYFRMHGRVRWRYSYDETELEDLATLLPAGRQAYVFFNNVSMIDDAQTYQRIVRGLGGRSE
jgi:uncharacterized protein YecE (DUF72 family)